VSRLVTHEPALVLIVEDEEPLAETLAFAVRAAGYTALVALNGREALDLARARWPALLITDLMVPHLDGAALIATLRADAVANGKVRLPTILVTAANPIQARAAGADVVLRKPFHLKDLQALLHRFLGPAEPSIERNTARAEG
jgi:DNA-binding response OmpR family regulator